MRALLICVLIIGAAKASAFDIDKWADDRVQQIEKRIAAEQAVKNGNDVKTCCHISGRCVIVESWKLCPAGFF